MSLFIVSTPIGNLEDISFRAVRTLKEVDLIAAEDTRHSKKLLSHYEIETPITSFHSHSSERKLQALSKELQNGDLALISDAGTPGISDPAWSLIQAALDAQVEIVPIPGPAAFLTALTGSGLPMDKFLYLGFIPAKKGRQTLFQSILDEKRTVIFYESPHRILKTLSQMLEILGPDRIVVLARELTKMHETFHRGTLAELHEACTKTPPKGEMTLLIAPANFKF
jgi:16S rRNA (cytidine1402-2'-O)-methyltransferase